MTSTISPAKAAATRSMSAYTLTPRTVDIPGINLGLGHFSLGSGPECDVVVDVPGVADCHCMLLVGPRRIVVKALSPLTWINDGAVRECNFGIGDRLIVGPVEFVLEEAAQTAPVHSQPFSPPTGIDEAIALLRPATQRGPNVFEESSHSAANETDLINDEIKRQRQHFEQLRKQLAQKESLVELRESEIGARATELAAEFDRLREERLIGQKTREKLKQAESALRQREHELELRLEECATQEEAIAALQSRIESDSASLQTRIQELDEQRESVSNALKRVEEKEQEQEAIRQSSAQQLNTLNEQEVALGVRESELQKQLHEFEQAKQREATQREEDSALSLDIARREETLHQQLAELECRNAELEVERQQLDSERSAFAAEQELQHQQFEDRQNELKSREESLSQREHSINARELELQTSEQAFHTAVEQSADEAEKEIISLKQQLDEERESLASLRAELESANRELEKFRDEESVARQSAADEVEELITQLGIISDQNADLQIRLEELALRLELKEDQRGQLEDELSIRSEEANRHLERIAELEWEVQQAACEATDPAATNNEDTPETAELVSVANSQLQSERDEVERERQACVAERQELSLEREALERTKTSVDRQAAELAETQRWLLNSQNELAEERAELEREREEFAELRRQASPDFGSDADLVDELGNLPSASEFDLSGERDAAVTTTGEAPDNDEAISLIIPEDDEELSIEFPEEEGNDSEDDFVNLEGSLDSASDLSFVQSFRLDHASSPGSEQPDAVAENNVLAEKATAAASSPNPKQDGLSGLRSQLAELFGMSTDSLREPTDDPDEATDEVESNSVDAIESLTAIEVEVAERSVNDTPQPNLSEKNADTGEFGAFEEPDSVEAYMERLLARSRPSDATPIEKIDEVKTDSNTEETSDPQSDDQLVPLNEINIEPTSESGSSDASAIDSSEAIEEDEEASSARRATTDEDRDAMRANMNSFRELANYSARSAVAKSQTARLRAALKSTSYIVAASWIATGMLATSKLWMGSTQWTTTLIALAASLGLSFRAFMLWLEIKKHQVDTPSTFDEVELSGKESVGE
ncbi:MAG: hypothetical protein R3C18_21900 [Planctomycetaceae bacterium]